MTTTLPPTDRHTIRLPLILTGPAHPPPPPVSPEDERNRALLAAILMTRPPQQRPRMVWHPVVAAVAQAHCVDMATRGYFGHTTPEGVSSNDRLRAAGLTLPAYYRPGINNVESLASGQMNAADAWAGWMASEGHRMHLLALHPFYVEQDFFGTGYYKARWAVVTVRLEMTSGE